MNVFLLAQGESNWGPVAIGLTIFLLLILLILFAVLFQFIGLYVRALVSGARVGLLDLIGMKLRKVNAAAIGTSISAAVMSDWRPFCQVGAVSMRCTMS